MTERGKNHTIEEWLAQPSERRLELIDGEFIADRPQRVRAEPFESVELHVGGLLGDDPE